MWRDIALTNRDEIRLAIKAWASDLAVLDAALAAASPSAIMAYLQEAKERREAWLRQFRPNDSDTASTA
jgi:prephenate dehydrogenase